MFLEYYNLVEQPFGVTPDTRFLYFNDMYREALASLWYGFKQGRGFMSLIADPGMGKTTLLYQFMQRLNRTKGCRIVFIFHTCCDSTDLMRYVLQDLEIVPGPDIASMHNQLNEVLVKETRAGRQVVIVIDEAQNLSEPVLESIRLLSDFESSKHKLLEIVLAGQRQLVSTLMQPNLLQLTQRISVTAFLDPLTPVEVGRYINHRLAVAGHKGESLFTEQAVEFIAWESGGTPRNINNLCFNALSTAFALDKKRVDLKTIEEVAADQGIRSLARRMQYPLAPPPASAHPTLFNLNPKDTATKKGGIPGHFRALSNIVWRTAGVMLILLCIALGPALSRRTASALRSPSGKVEESPKNVASKSTPAISAPAPATAQPPSALAPPAPETEIVVVEPKQSLSEVCLKRLGMFNAKLLARIIALNPGLEPDHIEIGQGIVMPVRPHSVDHKVVVRAEAAPVIPSKRKGI